MTPQKLLTPPAIAAALLLVGTLVVSAIVLLRGDAAAPGAQDVAGDAYAAGLQPFAPLEAWDTVPGVVSGLRLVGEAGPALQLDAQTRLALSPTIEGFSPFRWTLRQEDAVTQFVGKAAGEGELAQAALQVVWTFVRGNPQASLALQLSNLPARRLARDIVLEMALPPGQAAPGTTPGTMSARGVTWRGGGPGAPALSFEQWNGSALKVASDDASEAVPTLLLEWWNHTAHPAAAACAGAADTTRAKLSARLMMTVGEPPEVIAWPYERGSVAALAPVFDLPGHHADPLLAEAAAPDARRWVLRAQTLLYGYSDSDDPRYANGGLLGNDLGATIIVPPAFLHDRQVQALAKSLRGTHVELAAPHADGAMPDVFAASSHVARELACAEFIVPELLAVPAVLVVDQDAEKTALSALNTAPGTVQVAAIPEFFDGRLHTLVTRGFGVEPQQALLDSHGLRVFSAPFVATRNPLIGAAHQSLLVPEPDGHWSVNDPLSGALVNLSLWRETAPLVVSSVAALARHARATQAVQWWWDGEGRLQVHNPLSVPIEGFTLALPGDLTARVVLDAQGNTVRIRRRIWPAQSASRDAQPLTLLWWDLAPGTVSLALERDATPVSHGLSARTWTLE